MKNNSNTLSEDTNSKNSYIGRISPVPDQSTDCPVLPRSKTLIQQPFVLKVLDNFLNDNECIQVQTLLSEQTQNPNGTNQNTWFNLDTGVNNSLLHNIDNRLCQLMGVIPKDSTTLQSHHFDGLTQEDTTDNKQPGNTLSAIAHGRKHDILGYSSFSLVIFLHNTIEGGELFFPDVNIKIPARRGSLVLWATNDRTGKPYPDNRCYMLPVKNSYQTVLSKNFYSHGKQSTKSENECIPAYTENGFVKLTIPPVLLNKLLAFYHGNNQQTVEEPDKIHILADDGKKPSELIELTDTLRNEIHQTLQQTVEAWIGSYLEPTYVFGIRRYLDGAELLSHRDRVQTHIASVILNIAQEVNKPWPLYIEDHNYRGHEVFLKPGEMVFYEGGRLSHGRPTPFDGQFFCNVFVHYKLKNQ